MLSMSKNWNLKILLFCDIEKSEFLYLMLEVITNALKCFVVWNQKCILEESFSIF